MSQSELGRETGIDPSYISKIELGVVEVPTLQTLRKLAKGLRCSVEDLAPEGYYDNRPKNVLERVRKMLLSDTTLAHRDRQEAVARIEDVYRRRRTRGESPPDEELGSAGRQQPAARS